MEEKELELAKRIFEDMCQAMDQKEWQYDRHDEDLVVTIRMQGEDLPVGLILRVNAAAQVVSVYSVLPVTVPDDKLVDVALAVCVANDGMINGGFDLDMEKKQIVWRLCTTYRGSLLGSEAFAYMVVVSTSTVDKYNERFMMLAKDMIDLKKFIELESK